MEKMILEISGVKENNSKRIIHSMINYKIKNDKQLNHLTV